MIDTANKVYNPQGWPQSRLKDYVEINPPVAIDSGDEVSYMPMECLRYDSIERRTRIYDNDASLNAFEDGDIVMAKVTPCFENGNIAIAQNLYNGKGIGTSEIFVLRAKGINTRYLFYYIQTPHIKNRGISSMSGTGGLKRINAKYFLDSILLLPSETEQTRITNFLDRKCADIDIVLEKTKASIEEYKKLKQSVITEAVTKGIHGEEPMKDSGIEWIGNIPQSWSVQKLKYYISKIESGTSVNGSTVENASYGQFGVLKTSSVSKNIFIPSENKLVDSADEIRRLSCPVCADTIIVSRMNTPELVGASGYSSVDIPNIYLPDRLWQVHFIKDVCVKYIWYDIISSATKAYYSSLSCGTSSSMQNISQGDFCNKYIALPNKNDQFEIAAYLDKKCSEIDSLIASKEQFITELESYKKSLIYEYVTGKKEVPSNA